MSLTAFADDANRTIPRATARKAAHRPRNGHPRAMELPERVRAAAADRTSGATPIALTAADGLLEVAADPDLLAAAVALLERGQPAMAPIWHLARAARSPAPAVAIAAVRDALAADTEAAVRTARAWLDRHRGPVATVSVSSLVDRVVEGRERGEDGRVAVLGADAVGPDAVLNAEGSAALAARLPALVVATAAKLVPGAVFERLAAPGFERVPLAAVAGVVVGAELLDPAEAGRRAAALIP